MASGRAGPPFIILFEQDCTDEPDDCVLVWKDSDHFGTRFYLAVETLERIGRLAPAHRT
jgi:hypothetical protein